VKVLYWTQLFHPYVGGVEVLGTRFLTAMRERGHELEVATSHGSLDLPDTERWDGFRINRFPFRDVLVSGDATRVAEAIASVAALKRRFRPDLVHVNLSDPSPFFHLRTAPAHPCPTLLAVPVSLGDVPAKESLLLDLLRSAEWVTAVSGAVRDGVERICPEASSRCSVIYNGLEPPATDPPPPPFEPPVVLCLGRIVRDKGFDVAVRAFARVVERHPSARLRIAGDGPERPALEALAGELGIGDSVELCGWVTPERVPALIADATVVAMPSRWQEAFGLVALQAAQVARPVVAARVGGLPEVVVDGETGLLVPSEDPERLAAAIAELLASPERCGSLGAAARRRAIESFSFERYVDDHERVYARLAA
jgi:glycogen synthase